MLPYASRDSLPPVGLFLAFALLAVLTLTVWPFNSEELHEWSLLGWSRPGRDPSLGDTVSNTLSVQEPD